MPMFCQAPRRAISPAIEDGRDAYVAGRGSHYNPYPPGTIFYDQWLTSWAQEEEENDEAIHALIQQRGRLGK